MKQACCSRKQGIKSNHRFLKVDCPDYGARFYDPQIGRFHTIDPMAVFTPGISPYSYADDDPINNIDYFGLGREEREERRRERHMRREARQRERERNRNAWDYGKGKSYNPHFATYEAHDPRSPYVPEPSGGNYALIPPEEVPSMNIGIPDLIPVSRPMPTPSFPIPNAGGKVSFSKEIYFQASSDRLYDIPANDQILTELVRTLQDFSQLTLFIYGNVQVDGGIPGHGEDALTQEVRYNGQWKTANDLMGGRARAVYKYLVSKGIDPKRLNYGSGNVYNSSERDMKKTSFEVRNP